MGLTELDQLLFFEAKVFEYMLNISYDRRVKVMYQEKAWCDQDMKEWISTK